MVSGNAAALKQLTVEMEEHCEIGRLLDLDVLDPRGEKMERQSLGLMPRRCLICGGTGLGLRQEPEPQRSGAPAED